MKSKVAIFLLALMTAVVGFPVNNSSTTGAPPQSEWNDTKMLYKELMNMGSNRNGTNGKDNEIMKFFDDMENLDEQMKRRDEELKIEREARESEDVEHGEFRNNTNSNFGAYLFLAFILIVFAIVFIFACIKSPAIAALICCDLCEIVCDGRRNDTSRLL